VIIAYLGVNPFITTLGTMVLVRGLVYLVTGGAPVGDERLPAAFLAFGSRRDFWESIISCGCPPFS
jgi:ribose/xylose/arabinose/galactoside ABC-type transport system permease subunit